MTPDRLAEITARRAERWDADQTTLRAWADTDWLVGEVERLRTIIADIDKLGCATIAMQRDGARDEVERLRGLLARLEWAGATYGDESACPNDECCMTPREGHVPGCWLVAELRPRP